MFCQILQICEPTCYFGLFLERVSDFWNLLVERYRRFYSKKSMFLLLKSTKWGEIEKTFRDPCYSVIQVWPIVLQPLTLGQVTLYFLKEDLLILFHYFLKKGEASSKLTFPWKISSTLFLKLDVPWLKAHVKNPWKDVDRNDILSLTEASDLEKLGEDVGSFVPKS